MKPRIFTRIALTGIVFVLSNAAHKVAAADPLDSWARRTVAGLTAHLNAVAYGNGVFVAVGDESTVVTSADGSTWSVGTAGSYGDLSGVRFLNGQFVAVGTTDKILFSADGSSWSAGTLPGAGAWDVAYGNGVYVVAGNVTCVSSNGMDWALTDPKSNPSPGSPVSIKLDAVVYANNRFVGLPLVSTATLFHGVYSTDGVNWTQGGNAPTASTTTTGRGGDLVWGDGTFVGTTRKNPSPAASSDGASWLSPLYSQEPAGVAVAHGQGYFVFVQQAPFSTGVTPAFWSSTNGTSWVGRFSIPSFYPPSDPNAAYYESMKGRVRGASFGGGTFVIVGESGYIVQSGSLGGMPLVVQQPQDRGAVADNPASFNVQASGSPPLSYQWFHNASVIPNATNVTHSIAHVQAGDSGGYAVVINNTFGSVTSRVAQLTVAFLGIDCYAGIKVLGVPGRTYRIEATPASGTPNWQTVTNLVLPQSPYIWIDYDAPALPARLYRAAELP